MLSSGADGAIAFPAVQAHRRERDPSVRGDEVDVLHIIDRSSFRAIDFILHSFSRATVVPVVGALIFIVVSACTDAEADHNVTRQLSQASSRRETSLSCLPLPARLATIDGRNDTERQPLTHRASWFDGPRRVTSWAAQDSGWRRRLCVRWCAWVGTEDQGRVGRREAREEVV